LDESVELSLEPIAAWLKAIAAETTYVRIAEAMLHAGTSMPHVLRGVAVLSEKGEVFESANAGFPRDSAEVVLTIPPQVAFKAPETLMERAIAARSAIVVDDRTYRSVFAGFESSPASALCAPLSHKGHAIGMLYLEAPPGVEAFSPSCLAVANMLASQASVSFESARLFEALRETHKWMTKGQQVGRMGSYRFNSVSRNSRGSREIYEILGLDPKLRPVPFEAYLARIHPDDLPSLSAAIEKSIIARAPYRHEYRVIHGDGSVHEVLAVGEWDENDAGELELEGIISDVTGAKHAQRALAEANAQLTRAAAMAKLGEVAGSIIHEINQPLTAIIAGAEASIHWLSREEPNLEEARAAMIRAAEQGRRASAVVQSLRSMAKDSETHFSKLDLQELIQEALTLANAEIEGAGVTLEFVPEGVPIPIYGDRVQLQQLVLNLVKNATDALRNMDDRPRFLRIGTRKMGQTVTVICEDNGPGIPPEVGQQPFEALYTTKASGLGLGLAICRKIISGHGGNIWYEPRRPFGTSFQFTLPLTSN